MDVDRRGAKGANAPSRALKLPPLPPQTWCPYRPLQNFYGLKFFQALRAHYKNLSLFMSSHKVLKFS